MSDWDAPFRPILLTLASQWIARRWSGWTGCPGCNTAPRDLKPGEKMPRHSARCDSRSARLEREAGA
jgi:hypothetical protein